MSKKEKKTKGNATLLDGLIWWAQLLIAVIVVPTIGLGVALATPGDDIQKAATFMLTCWISVWLGMRLMNKAHNAKK